MRKRFDLLCFILIFGFVSVQSQNVKICVASDLHYFDPSLLINDGNAFQNYVLNDRKLIKESSAVITSLMQAFKEEQPDIVLISGDLTKDGEKINHQKVACFLDTLEMNGKTKVFVVPGNHDVNNGITCAFDGDKTIPVENINKETFSKIYNKFGYSESIYSDSASLSYVAEPVDGLWILGIDACLYDSNKPNHNSITGGRLKHQTYSWVINILKQAKQENKTVIAFMHHGIIEHFNKEDSVFPEYLVKGFDTISNRWANEGLRVVFTGHFHAQDIVRKNVDSTNFLYDIGTGSAVTYPCPYRTINFEDSVMRIQTKYITSINVDLKGKSFHDYAGDFLEKALTNTTKIKLMSSPYNLTKIQANILTPHVVKAMMACYSGDEKIPATENSFIDLLINSGRANQIKAGYSLKYLWTDLIPADNNVILNLENGSINDFIY